MFNFKTLATAALFAATTFATAPAMAGMADGYRAQQNAANQTQQACLNFHYNAQFTRNWDGNQTNHTIASNGKITQTQITNGRCWVSGMNTGEVVGQEFKWAGFNKVIQVEAGELVEYSTYLNYETISRDVIGVRN